MKPVVRIGLTVDGYLTFAFRMNDGSWLPGISKGGRTTACQGRPPARSAGEALRYAKLGANHFGSWDRKREGEKFHREIFDEALCD